MRETPETADRLAKVNILFKMFDTGAVAFARQTTRIPEPRWTIITASTVAVFDTLEQLERHAHELIEIMGEID